jgi:predicted solute-binding protein
VDSLNAVPLTCGLEDQVLFTAPARLARLLEEGRLDAALVSVTELLTKPRYAALDGIAIASHGPVRSVLLAHRVPLDHLREVFCDPASLTSVNLLRVLLAERGCRPTFTPLRDYAGAAGHDAVLLIGDRALDFAFAGHRHHVWDLGAAWQELTGLPFVYAVWTLAPEADASRVAALLRTARDRGLRELDSIIRRRVGYTLEFRREYLTQNIGFELGPEEKRGLLQFAELLRKHGTRPVIAPRYRP